MQYLCGTYKEIGEEVVRAIQSTSVRDDVVASLENQAPGRCTRAQARCRSIDPNRRSSTLSID
jgi:hypothetical protein